MASTKAALGAWNNNLAVFKVQELDYEPESYEPEEYTEKARQTCRLTDCYCSASRAVPLMDGYMHLRVAVTIRLALEINRSIMYYVGIILASTLCKTL